MDHDFCPLCGNRCAGVEESTPGDSSIPDEPEEDVATTAIEAVADVAVAALETVGGVVAEHEETDRTAETTEMLETMAEESSEVAVAEAIVGDVDEEGASDAQGADEGDEREGAGEPEPEHEGDEDRPGEGDEDEGEGDTEAGHDEDATPVEVPPQLHDEPERHEGRRRSSAPAFRRHRAPSRRRR